MHFYYFFWKDESRVGTHRFIVARLNGCEGQPVDLLIRSNTPWPNTGHKAAVARLSAAACKLINDTLLLWLKGGNEKKKTRDGPMSGKQRYACLICGFIGIERAWLGPPDLTSQVWLLHNGFSHWSNNLRIHEAQRKGVHMCRRAMKQAAFGISA